MSAEPFLFAILASAVATAAVGVVASGAVIRAAVWLLVALVGVAGLYFLLGAEFLGAAQLIVYVGGTLVLVVFGGMLTGGGPFHTLRTKPAQWVVAGLVAAGLFAALVAVSLRFASPPAGPLPGTGQLGLAFLGVAGDGPRKTTYLLPFEIVSIHLLVVLIGAAYLARAKKRVKAAP